MKELQSKDVEIRELREELQKGSMGTKKVRMM